MKPYSYIYKFAGIVKSLLTVWPPFLAKNPLRARFLLPWFLSLRPEAEAYKEGVPLITYGAIEWLESFLDKQMTVFEWGTGGSTVFIAERVNQMTSVEHNPKWFFLVSNALSKKGIRNCEYLLREPGDLDTDTEDFTDPRAYLSKYIRGVDFKDYCSAIDSYPDGHFDLVFIDGRARSSCIFHAHKKVRPGGFLMLDDSYRERYRKGATVLEGWERVDFYGPKSYARGIHWATIWQKPKNNN